jgi:hypothetical protein
VLVPVLVLVPPIAVNALNHSSVISIAWIVTVITVAV